MNERPKSVTFHERMAKKSWTAAAALGLGMVLLLGLVDYLTGYEFRIDLFYLVPISFTAWYIGRMTSYWFALITIAVSTLSDALSGKVYTALGLELWNTLIRFGFYLVVAALLSSLRRTIRELQNALREVKELRGILPICSSCKKIRTDEGYWQNVEEYISSHTKAEFSHGICKECTMKLYPEYYDKIGKEPDAK